MARYAFLFRDLIDELTAKIPWSGAQGYGKNLRIQMGRCPVRSIFPQALEKLRQKQHLLG
jgi:hypothetical protein